MKYHALLTSKNGSNTPQVGWVGKTVAMLKELGH